jgi:hypothetical protein
MIIQKLIRMSEQKFEKQVRQAMDEFSLSPTAPVWDKIAAEIKRKKNMRRFVLWLLPLALLSSGIIWWTVSTNEKSSKISQKTKAGNQKINEKESNTLNKIAIPDKENTTVTMQSKKEEFTMNEEKATTTFKKTTYTDYTIAKKSKAKVFKNKITSYSGHSTKNKKKEELFSEVTPVLTKEKFQDSAPKINNAVIPNKPDQNKDLVTPQKTDTTQTVKQSEEKPIDAAKTPEQTEKQKPQNQKTKKLQFVAIVGIGYSGITSGLFDGFGQKSLQDFAGPSSLQSGPGGGTNLPPSNIKRGLAYSVGFGARKKLKSRSTISTGMQYQYFSTKINVGTMGARDSTLTNVSRDAINYYRNDNQLQHYTNQFHFIVLPFSYDYQLFKKIPVHIGVGLSLSQLISSNALHYNSTANIYYKDNSLLNKTQARLFTNLAYKLLREKKFTLDVGPQMNYGLTPLQKNSNSKKQHLFSIGINTQLNF